MSTAKKGLLYYLGEIVNAIKGVNIDAKVQSDWAQSDNTKSDFIKNKPAATVKIEVDDITNMTADQLDALTPGDAVIKKTGKQKHTYIVSYKGDGAGEGICLSYNAAGYGETVSYDRTESGWTYNSTDVKTYGA